MTDILLDLETLSSHSDAVILSIGAVAFDYSASASQEEYDRLIQTGLDLKLEVPSQVSTYKRKICDSALQWWSEQSEEAREVLKPAKRDQTLPDALKILNAWIGQSGYDFKKSHCWCRGLYFDFPILESAFRQVDIKPAYNLWRARDSRTLIDVLTGTDDGYHNPGDFNQTKHRALDDCAFEVMRILSAIAG